MKKVFKILPLIALLAITTACNKPSSSSNPNTNTSENNSQSSNTENVTYLEGTDAAKYLIASTNLDSSLLTGDLFTTGPRALRRVAKMTRKYSQQFGPDASNSNPNSYVDKIGDKYIWVSDEDYGNSLDAFRGTARGIELTAENGANLIDYFKTNIRVVDKWIKDGNTKYYLSVTKDYEAIYSYEDDYKTFNLVKRTVDENGDNVFEIYSKGQETQHRMKYIPGKRYEYSINSYDSRYMTNFLVADYSKGYWNVMNVDDRAYNIKDNYSAPTIHNLVLKDEACYEFFYSVYQDNRETAPEYIELISSDQKRDLLRLTNRGLALYTTGVYGLKHIEVTAKEENVIDDWDYSELPENIYVIDRGQDSTPTHHADPIAVTETTSFKKGDTFVDGKVEIEIIRVGGIGLHPGYGEIELIIHADSIEERFEILEDFLEETGLELARDIEDCKKGLLFAVEDSAQFPSFYKWNGKLVNNFSSLAAATKIEFEKFDEYSSVYDEIKEVEVIDINDQEAINANIHFADIKNITNGTNSSSENVVTIQDFKIQLEDHLLFVKNKDYKIDFAIAKVEDNKFIDLHLLENSSTISNKYTGSDEIIFTQSTTLTIPHITNVGNYEIVAFVSTFDESIRLSSLTRVPVTVSDYQYTENGYINTFTQNDSYLSINSKLDSTIRLNISGSYDKTTLETTLISEAYERGLLDSSGKLEVLVNESWTLVEDSSYSLESGKYRVSYKMGEVEDYVICDLTSTTISTSKIKGIHTISSFIKEVDSLMEDDLTIASNYVDKFENNKWTTISSKDGSEDLVSGLYRVSFTSPKGEIVHCIVEFESNNIYSTVLALKTYDELKEHATEVIGSKGTLVEDGKIEFTYDTNFAYTEVNDINEPVRSGHYKLEFVDSNNNTNTIYIKVVNELSIFLITPIEYDELLDVIQEESNYTLDSLEETEVYYFDSDNTQEWILLEEGTPLNKTGVYETRVSINGITIISQVYIDF